MLRWAITGRNLFAEYSYVVVDTERSGGFFVLKGSFTVSLSLLDVVVLFVLVLFLFLLCVWTSSLLRIYLLSNSSRSVDRPCHELDWQSLQKKRCENGFVVNMSAE